MTNCFRGTESFGWQAFLNLIDHRYFYPLDGRGSCTCGLIRNAVAERLLELKAEDNTTADRTMGMPIATGLNGRRRKMMRVG